VAQVTRIFLVRHGQTQWNLQKRLQGHKNSPLTATGRKQALHVRKVLAGVTLHVAYVSPLPRALETLSIIIEGQETEVHEAPSLKEIHLGPWEGKTREEIRVSHPQQYNDFWNNPERFTLQGAETFHHLQTRVVRQLETIFSREQGRNILVVSHWIALKVALAHYSSIALAGLPGLADPGNGSFFVLSQTGGGEVILERCGNDTV